MALSHYNHVHHHVNTYPSRPPMMIHLHGRDNNITFDEKTNTYNWIFRTNNSFSASSIQLVDFDIPIPQNKSKRLFVRVPKISCILESNENNRDFC